MQTWLCDLPFTCLPLLVCLLASVAQHLRPVWEGSSLLESHPAFPTTPLTLDFRFCALSYVILTLSVFCTLTWGHLHHLWHSAPVPQRCESFLVPSAVSELLIVQGSFQHMPCYFAFIQCLFSVSVPLLSCIITLREQIVLRTFLFTSLLLYCYCKWKFRRDLETFQMWKVENFVFWVWLVLCSIAFSWSLTTML